MSLIVAVPCGIAAALAYGASSAVQHESANTGTDAADARGLLNLLTNPRWLMSVGGDALGLILQVIALATGPVVLIQPLLVLAVPISLPVGWLLARSWPSSSSWRRDALGCLAVVGGLAVFFILVGDPGSGSELHAGPAAWTSVIALAVTAIGCLAVRGQPAAVRAGVLGALAGSLFGVVGVLLNAVATAYDDHGLSALQQESGWVPLAGLLVLGAVAFVLTQVSFQIGELAASFPANESSAPIVAVIVGAVLLHETVPVSALRLPVYLICLVAVVGGTVALARPHPSVGNNER